MTTVAILSIVLGIVIIAAVVLIVRYTRRSRNASGRLEMPPERQDLR